MRTIKRIHPPLWIRITVLAGLVCIPTAVTGQTCGSTCASEAPSLFQFLTRTNPVPMFRTVRGEDGEVLECQQTCVPTGCCLALRIVGYQEGCCNSGTVGAEGGTVALSGVASIDFAKGTFSADTEVLVETTADDKVKSQFDEFTAMFRPSDRLSYEVIVELDSVPLSETIPIEMTVPEDFQILSGNGLEDSTYNAEAQTVSFDLPANSFIGIEQGTFVATITLASTPGSQTFSPGGQQEGSDRNRRLQEGGCEASSIRCPVSGGCTVTSPYSNERRHPLDGVTRPHWGVDYRGPTGTPIIAAAAGTVERSYLSTTYGNTVIIRHSDGGATLYAHLDSRKVAKGDPVTLEQQIGTLGSTGKSTGPHLHFEYVPNGQIIQSKNRIDPDPCVGMKTDGSITAGDNGSRADDSFQLSVDGFVIGTTTIGGQNNLSVNNLIPGPHILTLEVVLAPDDIGTYFVELKEGLTFEDGTTLKTSNAPESTIISWTFIVPDN